MKELAQGLFAVEEQMPCSPKVIVVAHYVLPNTLERLEREEAAARIISFSQQLDRWVGVSWDRIATVMEKDSELHNIVVGTKKHNESELWRVRRARRWYYVWCVCTIGLYAILVEKPIAWMLEIPEDVVPCSGLFAFGPEYVVDGVRELIKAGLLRHARIGVVDVFFPTPALISRIMEKQDITC